MVLKTDYLRVAKDIKHFGYSDCSDASSLLCQSYFKLKILSSDTSEWGTSKLTCTLNLHHQIIHVSASVFLQKAVLYQQLYSFQF